MAAGKARTGGSEDAWGSVYSDFAHFYPNLSLELLDERQIDIYLANLPRLVRLLRPLLG